ncbi:MAG: DUF2318 domain-containing protein [Rhodospirillaceae bacterium]|nr:DUF2318 domain-containing protein [Rhodospirillaceae bacterium]
MSEYLASVIKAFLGLGLVLGLLLALVPPARRGQATLVAAWLTGVALAIGAAAGSAALAQGGQVEIRLGLRTAALAFSALSLLALALALWRPAALVVAIAAALAGALLATLGVAAMVDVLGRTADIGFTATEIINTELLLNLAALVVGVAVLIGLAVSIRRLGADLGRRGSLAALAAVLAVLAVFSVGDAMLALLQLGWMGVTSGRISFVAQVTDAAPLAPYALLAVALAVLALARLKAPPRATGARGPRLRERRAARLSALAWSRAAAASVAFLIAALLHQDLYASLPPSLSAAEPVVPDAEGQVRLPVEPAADGNLHRFAYIASDGRRVRFFLINRYDAEHVRLGVVFDACMICGDDGYIQDGNDIICIACNVRLFRPSIGNPGGCNPIPLDHVLEAGDVVIAAAALERGARYFSEVVSIPVTDPVTGAELINTEAPHRYDFRGRTFFFEGRESYERFRADPETFVGDLEARRWRVQGHQEADG